MACPDTSEVSSCGPLDQHQLFELSDALPAGWSYELDFLSVAQEQELVRIVQALPLEQLRYKSYVARRRGISFGGHYDFDAHQLKPAPEIPAALFPLREQAARWLDKSAEDLRHMLIAEYQPGTPLGWHRDVPDFEDIVGISLAGDATLSFRRYPPRTGRHDPKAGRIDLRIAPRSIYRMTGAARWEWQHAVLPTEALRYVVTLRTFRETATRSRFDPERKQFQS